MSNVTYSSDLPPLPSYSLSPLPPLVAPIPDKILTLILPVAVYWIVSLGFHWIDVNDYLPQYRLHTPAEVLKRNHVSRRDVVRDVILQQIIQTAMGVVLGMTEPDDVFGKEEYDVAVWARRIRVAQRSLPWLLSVLGLNATALSKDISGSYPMLAAMLSGGDYPFLTQEILSNGQEITAPAFAAWELWAAKAIYWVVIPAIQFMVAILVVDTWQYFLHRAMHMNKWLYSKLAPRLVCFEESS